MEWMIDFFSDAPTWFRATMLLGGMLFFWILEGLIPLFTSEYKKYRHAGLNLFFTGTTAFINLGLAGLLIGAAHVATTNAFGLLYLFSAPLWIKTIVGIMLLDFISAWFIHWLEHKVKWMWLFHLIHHSDTNVDVTTGLRHHPGESIFRMAFTILAVLALGTPVWMVILYQSLSAIFTHFNHANISLPKKLDQILSYVFVTPDMHKIHHHKSQPLIDTNYGNIFALWDRMFGTFEYVADIKTLEYGIGTHIDPKENDRLGNLLKIPFQTYRKPIEKFSSQKSLFK